MSGPAGMTVLGAAGPVWWLIALAGVPGLAAVVFGAWMVWGGRAAPGRPVRASRWRDGMTAATRLSVGLGAIGAGYHAISYASPAHWLPLRVPPERWYLAVGLVVVLVGGSLLMDRRAK